MEATLKAKARMETVVKYNLSEFSSCRKIATQTQRWRGLTPARCEWRVAPSASARDCSLGHWVERADTGTPASLWDEGGKGVAPWLT